MVRYTCLECSASFPNRQRYERHLTSHSSERSHQCTECGKMFKMKQNLVAHMQLHSSEVFYCDTCGNSFKQKESLIRHVKTHLKLEHYQCEVCGKIYKMQDRLKSHIRVFHGETEASVCKECGQWFKYRHTLKKHMIDKHSQEIKGWKCTKCSKRFAHKNLLIQHLKRLHRLCTDDIRALMTAVDPEPEVTTPADVVPNRVEQVTSLTSTVRQKVLFISPLDPSTVVALTNSSRVVTSRLRYDSTESSRKTDVPSVMTSSGDIMTSRIRSDSVSTDLVALRSSQEEQRSETTSLPDMATSHQFDDDDVVTSLGAVEIVTSSVCEGPWTAGRSPPNEIFNESDEDNVTSDDDC